MKRPTQHDRETTWSKYLATKLGGIAEYRTEDGSRVDIVTDEYAIEVEWATKWKEAIGQALFYGVMTGRKPAIILMQKTSQEWRHVMRAAVACGAGGITIIDGVDTYKTNDKWDPHAE